MSKTLIRYGITFTCSGAGFVDSTNRIINCDAASNAMLWYVPVDKGVTLTGFSLTALFRIIGTENYHIAESAHVQVGLRQIGLQSVSVDPLIHTNTSGTYNTDSGQRNGVIINQNVPLMNQEFKDIFAIAVSNSSAIAYLPINPATYRVQWRLNVFGFYE
jgi:hypothetical protein